ncbi:MAG: phosphohistidine phosphatase SixA [Oligoflexales bacterium]|nr:phosphohistidine phosphatase SixA [Oligoflexales bacterium]
MKLLLLRHAIAEDLSQSQKDEDRALTKSGIEKMKRYAKIYSSACHSIKFIVASPYLRAQQTAKILQKRAGCALFTHSCLIPSADPKEIFAVLSKELEMKTEVQDTIALVGHQPYLSYLLANICQSPASSFVFKKGGAAFVEIDNLEKSTGRLLWMSSPSLFREISEQL